MRNVALVAVAGLAAFLGAGLVEAQPQQPETGEELPAPYTPPPGSETVPPPPATTEPVPPPPEAPLEEVPPPPPGSTEPVQAPPPAWYHAPVAPAPAPAPGPPPPPNILAADPLAIAFGFLVLSYERALGRLVSIFVQPEVLVWRGLFIEEEIEMAGVGGTVGVRFFPIQRQHAPRGFWVAPLASVSWITAEDTDGDEAWAVALGVAASVGYTWILGKFAFSIGTGIGYLVAVAEDDDSDELDYEFSRVTGAGRLALGVAF